jgi:hypothetical protein
MANPLFGEWRVGDPWKFVLKICLFSGLDNLRKYPPFVNEKLSPTKNILPQIPNLREEPHCS